MFDPQLPGFSPVVLVSRKEIEELQARVQGLLDANNKLVEQKRNLQRRVSSFMEHVAILRDEAAATLEARENALPPFEVLTQISERAQKALIRNWEIGSEYPK